MLNNFKTYQLALNLYRECEKQRLSPIFRDQMIRASLSVVLNTAEGSAKPTVKDRRRYYAIALGSVREVQAIIDVLKLKELEGMADQVAACLYRLVYPKGSG